MKVLLLIDSLGLGGAETHVETLALELRELGCSVSVASRGGEIADRLCRGGIRHLALDQARRNDTGKSSKDPDRAAKARRSEPLDPSVVPDLPDIYDTTDPSIPSIPEKSLKKSSGSTQINRSYPIEALSEVKFIVSVAATIARERPDIVHAHTRMTAFAAHFACRALDIPLVVTAHALFSMTRIKKRLSKWGDATIAVSEDIRDHLLRHAKLPPSRIAVIENGIRLPEAKERSLSATVRFGNGDIIRRCTNERYAQTRRGDHWSPVYAATKFNLNKS